MTGLSPQEKDTLNKLRKILGDSLQNQHDEEFLIRFLKGREFDLMKTEKALRNTLQWRKQWGVDHLVDTWDPPEVLKKYYPVGFCGYDKEGCPVWLIPFGQCDIKGLLHSVKKAEYIKYTVMVLEKSVRKMKEQTKKLNKPINKHSVIFDLKGYSLKHVVWKPAMDMMLHHVQMYEANYPELLKRAYVINAPKIFSAAFTMIKPFLQEKTMNKISIQGEDGWKDTLLKDIPKEQIPKHWGGTRVDADGDPRCASEICMGGEVPKSYYMASGRKLSDLAINDNLTPATINSGSHLDIEMKVTQPGSLLKWEFKTESRDIGLSIYKKDGDKLQEVMTHRRVNAEMVMEDDMILCTEPATYILRLDNSFSYIRSKKVWYSVYVVAPTD